MNISKISRSIVVIIFVASILCLSYLDVSLMIKNYYSTSLKLGTMKVIFSITIIMLLLFYVLLKRKLYKLKLSRSLSLMYRYGYMLLMVIGINIYTSYNMFLELSKLQIAFCMIILIINAIVIKKIVFNVCKSDILSILAVIMYTVLPNVITQKYLYIQSLLLVMFMCTGLLFLQLLIDELKQLGIKNKKYLIYTIISGVCFGFSVVLGINIYVFIVLAIIMMVITNNLDSTHINLNSNFVNKLSSNQKNIAYKIERLTISKLLIVLLMQLILIVTVVKISSLTLEHFEYNIVKQVINSREGLITQITFKNLEISSVNILTNLNNFLGTSKCYYLIMFSYIIIIEIMTIILKRRYDTKSTVIKSLFLLILVTYAIFGGNIHLYQPVFAVAIILIALVNTTNLYLNREERIKLLNA